jgi:glycerate kinase
MGARIVPGFDWVAQIIDLRAKIAACDLVVTGEGCLDSQSLVGKATGQLAAMCRQFNKPLWVVPARCSNIVPWQEHGIERVEPVSRDDALADGQAIAHTVEALFSP